MGAAEGEGQGFEEGDPEVNNPEPDIVAYAVEPEEWAKLGGIVAQLHAGNDQLRDWGHRIWLIMKGAVPIREGELE